MSNIEELLANVNIDDQQIPYDRVKRLKALRKNTRREITKAFGKVKNRQHMNNPNITLQKCDDWHNTLVDIDDQLDEDEKSKEYLEKIYTISATLIKEEDERSSVDTSTDSPQSNSDAVVNTNPQPYFSKNPEIAPFDGKPSTYHEFEKRFEIAFEHNRRFQASDLFFAFVKLVGEHGAILMQGLDPDADGLKLAKQRMKTRFDNPYLVRKDVEKRMECLNSIDRNSSTAELLTTLVQFEACLKALKACNTDPTYINGTFLRMITHRIPFDILLPYREAHQRIEDTAHFLDYLRDKINCIIEIKDFNEPEQLERVNPAYKPPNKGRKAPINSIQTHRRSNFTTCKICNGDHRTIWCRAFDVNKRKEIVQQKRLCLRCLEEGHFITNCTSAYRCKLCTGDHSSVICHSSSSRRSPQLNQTNNSNSTTPTPPSQSSPNTSTGTIMSPIINAIANEQTTSESQSSNNTEIPDGRYLCTALARIKGRIVRLMIDNGASITLITERLANELNLKTQLCPSENCDTIADTTHSLHFNNETNITLEALDGMNSIDVTAKIVPVTKTIRPEAIPELAMNRIRKRGYQLADVNREHADQYPVEVIIGVQYQLPVWQGPIRRLTKDMFIQHSIFGWVISGVKGNNDNSLAAPLNLIMTEYEYEHRTPESPTVKDRSKQLEEEYLSKFIAEKVKFCGGQYVVNFPWITPSKLVDNRLVALSRLNRLVKSLRERNLFEDYKNAIQETIDNFAERVSDESSNNRIFYLPHHCVIRPDKSTTRLRVVYDGSSHAPNAKSLNDAIFKGFTSWHSLDILTKFRFGDCALVADIEKAFMMIGLATEDRDATRFLWYDSTGNIATFRFKVVPFGVSASPFLLYAVMRAHFNKHREEFSDIIPFTEKCFYVDDFIFALPISPNHHLNYIKERVTELFKKGGMNLRKWRTNVVELDQQWSPEASTPLKVLGHFWHGVDDTLSPISNAELPASSELITKRQLSSFLSAIYDPLGLINPYVISLRMELRSLWYSSFDWDQTLPSELSSKLYTMMQQASHIASVTVPRNVLPATDKPAELIIFCDASKHAVGAVAYCRTSQSSRLITSKVKLSTKESLPDLELDAMFIAANLAKYLLNFYNFSKVYILSDSFINLQRLIKHPNRMESALAYKISKLTQIVDAVYRHVTTKQNIADIVSRGCSMSKLMDNSDWWNGPAIEPTTLFEHTIEATVFALTTTSNQHICTCQAFDNYSLMIEFYKKKANVLQSTGNQSNLHEDALALQLMIKEVQSRHFAEEISSLEKSSLITNPSSDLKKYDCFIDDEGLLRLRTRLHHHEQLCYDEKNPLILPDYCRSSRLIVKHHHEFNHHPGVDRTLCSIRERYFFIRARRLVKHVIYNCILCRSERGKSEQPTFGPLPSFRLAENSIPFTNVGVDICGPLKVNTNSSNKRYCLIFTCATTRSVHLELISDMTADEVFLALRRFIARRGIPELIYSDNGTQLVKVRKQLKRFFKEIRILHPELELRFQWQLQTAASPWRGGFFERLVRSVKTTLRAMTFRKQRDVNDGELTVLLTEIEGFINSRPLFTISNDDHTTTVITPAHFYHGRSLRQLPPVGNIDSSQLTRNDLISNYISSQRCRNAVWRLFRDHYIKNLRQFHENPSRDTPKYEYKIGDSVILKSNTPLNTWPIGTITALHTSPDGVIRSIDVQVRSRSHQEIKTRSIQSIIPLECAKEQHHYDGLNNLNVSS